MDKLFIVANWKSHKSLKDAHNYFISFLNKDFSHFLHSGNLVKKKEVIICPPTALLAPIASYLEDFKHEYFSISLGAQDISRFDEGPYTGEESGKVLSEFVKYVIIGHAERRKIFLETDTDLQEKVARAYENGIEPIYCITSLSSPIPSGVRIVAYEPEAAIGSGHAHSAKDIEIIAQKYKKDGVHYFLYGGSVDEINVSSFTESISIDGVIVGSASLEPETFSRIVSKA